MRTKCLTEGSERSIGWSEINISCKRGNGIHIQVEGMVKREGREGGEGGGGGGGGDGRWKEQVARRHTSKVAM